MVERHPATPPNYCATALPRLPRLPRLPKFATDCHKRQGWKNRWESGLETRVQPFCIQGTHSTRAGPTPAKAATPLSKRQTRKPRADDPTRGLPSLLVYLSTCLLVYLSTNLPIYQSTCLLVYQSTAPPAPAVGPAPPGSGSPSARPGAPYRWTRPARARPPGGCGSRCCSPTR